MESSHGNLKAWGMCGAANNGNLVRQEERAIPKGDECGLGLSARLETGRGVLLVLDGIVWDVFYIFHTTQNCFLVLVLVFSFLPFQLE